MRQNPQSCTWLAVQLVLKIQIKYADTTDILIKDNSTRDEWNNLFHLFNISHLNSFCCFQNFSSTSCPETMTKRMQEEQGKEIIVIKSKPTLKLISYAATRFSTVQSPIFSKSPGTLRTPCQHDWKSAGKLVRRQPNQDVALSSQVTKRCRDGHEYEETRSDKKGSGASEFPWIPEEYEEICDVWKLRHRRYWHNMTTQSPNIYIYIYIHKYCLCCTSWESFFRMCDRDTVANRETKWKISTQ